jgi:hypothetical protein
MTKTNKRVYRKKWYKKSATNKKRRNLALEGIQPVKKKHSKSKKQMI